MKITFNETAMKGVIVIESEKFEDHRGYFREVYHSVSYGPLGKDFLQDNLSYSKKNVLRGLHYQLTNPQGKLISVVRGEIFDVAVDIMRGSPSFGEWFGVVLSATNNKQIYIHPGYAHGFCVLSEYADVYYKCTELYSPGDEYSLIWSDVSVNIDWPVSAPILSKKDQGAPALAQIPEELLPEYKG